jgi:hypothetical protein
MAQRAGQRVLQEARRAELAYARRLRAPLVIGAIGAMAAAGAYNVVFHGWAAGFVTGGALATFAAGVVVTIRDLAGTGPRRLGADAERTTSDLLRRHLGNDWVVFDHVSFERYDIDHLVVGPGGAFAVETKWSATPWRLDEHDRRFAPAYNQALESAQRARGLLRSKHVNCDLPVTRYSCSGTALPRDALGTATTSTRYSVPSSPNGVTPFGMTSSMLRRLRTAQRAYRRSSTCAIAHDVRNHDSALVMVGFEALGATALAMLVVGCISALASAVVLSARIPVAIAVAPAALLGGAGVLVRRRTRFHALASAWSGGIAVTFLAAAILAFTR